MHGTANLDAKQQSAHDAPAANTAAVVTLTPSTAEEFFVVDQVVWSYDAAPVGGRVTIAVGGNVPVDFDITNPGPGSTPWWRGVEGGHNETIVITLAAAGASVKGKLNVSYR